jgi:hypothetical protein
MWRVTVKWTTYLTISCAAFLTTGCGQKEPTIVEAPLFCDVEEPRRFTQEEIDWRAANAPWNLRRDYKTNLTWDRECLAEKQNASRVD